MSSLTSNNPVPISHNTLDNLRLLAKDDKIPHGLLITSPKGMGSQYLAYVSACYSVCQNMVGADFPCLKCPDCVKVFGKIHPDVMVYGDSDTPNKEYLIDKIREIRSSVHIMPNQSKYKVYVLLNADTITDKAQNAMLKMIEEPPSHLRFVLTAENPQKLLETIRSRVVTLTMEPVAKVEIVEYLTKSYPNFSSEEIQSAANLCNGNYGRAVDILTGQLPQLEYAKDLYNYLVNNDCYNFNRIAFKVCKSGDFRVVFTYLKELLIKNCLKTRSNQGIYLITPLQAVAIADIIDSGIKEDFFNINSNLLSASISARIFKTYN